MTSFQSAEAQTILRAKLLSRVEVTEAGCWEWQGAKFPDGYGNMRWNGKGRGTHRLSYEAFKGHIPDGLCVLHSCDNPPCINPDHLRVGTKKENTQDCLERGRFRDSNGEANNLAKLTEADVLEIRSSNESPSVLADRFNVDRTNIWMIQTGKTWKRVEMGNAPTRTPGRPAKLSVEDIDAIRASDLSGRQLADIFNVSQATVSMVRSGKYVLTTAKGA